MEELDILKKDWKRNAGFPRVSEQEIYGMLHKKSSSIVKWIVVISALEFIFLVGLTLLLIKDNPTQRHMEGFKLDNVTIPITIGSYVIILYFVYLFYINYKKITTTDNVKNLMASILRVRKTVSNYIFVNIAYTLASLIIIFAVYFKTDIRLSDALHGAEAEGKALEFYLIIIISTLLWISIFVAAIYLFYRLIYGLLLKRLRKNYDELKKIDL